MVRHIIKQGEHLPLLAEDAGFRDSMSVWQMPANEQLRKRRPNPCVLNPGDALVIPDKREKTVSIRTTQVHWFVLKAETVKLRIAVLDFDNRPLPKLSVTLDIEGSTAELTTGTDGVVEREIPRTARTGRVKIARLDIDLALAIGRLNPATEDQGWRARLINLGYYLGAVDDDGAVAAKFWGWALEEFQCDFGLKITGQADSATIAKLESVHGS